MIYKDFANCYDNFVYDIDYKKWVDYYEKIFHSNRLAPRRILDLGCGTGNILIELARKGYETCGVDMSCEMLAVAKKKMDEEHIKSNLICMDMVKFKSNNKFDVVISALDSLNYITDMNAFKKLIRNVYKSLNVKGLFIFDLNSIYKYKNILAENVFYETSDEQTFIWQNNYNQKTGLCEFDVTFFMKNGSKYDKFDEYHVQRAYKISEIRKSLNQENFSATSVYEHLTFNKVNKKSERILFIARKD